MGKTKFKYPPCRINPDTDKPFTRHKWIIPTVTDRQGFQSPKLRVINGYIFYHVICERCKIRDPQPPRY